MLKANKSRWFETVFAVYSRNLFKRRFHSFRVFNAQALLKPQPKIIYLNHSSWWDGLIAFEVSRLANTDFYIMMEEKQLRKLSLFRRLGAFSVVRENARQAIESINYAVEMLRGNSRRAVWIFPQGEILPNDTRPLNFYRGLARIVEKVGDCAVIPCAIRCEFLGDFKPEIFAAFGEPEIFKRDDNFDSKKLTANFEDKMTVTLDALKRSVVSGEFSEYEKIL